MAKRTSGHDEPAHADSVRDPVAIQAEIESLLQLVRDERALALGEFDDMIALILSAERADPDRPNERDALCVRLRDVSYDLLGDCDPVDMLLALLGYEDPEDDEETR